MAVQRDPPGAHDLVGTGHLDRCVQQRMTGGFQPVPRALERVGRQVDPAAPQDGRPVHVDAPYVRFGQRQQYPPLAAVLAQQGTHDRGVYDGFPDRTAQYGVRCHFDERAVPVRTHAAGRALEQYRLAHVAVPVGSVEPGGVEPCAGHRGVERDPRRSRVDRCEIAQQILPQRLDLGGVARGVDARYPAARRVRGEQFVQRGGVAGDGDRFRRVDRSDAEPIAPRREVDPADGQW